MIVADSNPNEGMTRDGEDTIESGSVGVSGPSRATDLFPTSAEISCHLETVRQDRLLLNRLDRWLLDEVKDDLGSRVLEVGCGHGNLISLLLNRELVVGTDFDADSVQSVRNRFRNHANVRALVFDATRPPPTELIDCQVDTVISLNVLEHIERDDLAVSNMVKLFAGNGTLIIIVPAHMCFYGTMDGSIGHFRRYTKAMMQALLAQAGAEVTRQFYHNVFGALGWWFSGCVLRCKTPPAGQLSLFNRLVPLLAFGERLLRPPFGLTLVTVARFRQ